MCGLALREASWPLILPAPRSPGGQGRFQVAPTQALYVGADAVVAAELDICDLLKYEHDFPPH